MTPPFRIIARDYFSSVELAWGIWAFGIAGLIILAWHCRRRGRSQSLTLWQLLTETSSQPREAIVVDHSAQRQNRRRSLGYWLKQEDGAAYTLSYVLAFPLYFIVMFSIIQSTIILIVKMGTVYASYSAARSAVVWVSAEPQSAADNQIRLAAVHAMTPFASSSGLHAGWMNASPGGAAMNDYLQAYREYTENGPATVGYLRRKYQAANWGVQPITITPRDPEPGQDVDVTVSFRMPMYFAWFGRVLDLKEGDGDPKFHTIRTTATLQSETPIGKKDQPAGRPIGIEYESL